REIDSLGLRKAKARAGTWSGHAWQRYRGHTAGRYAFAPVRNAKTWREAWTFTSAPGRRYFEIATGVGEHGISDLSPAEKYDLLISDPRVKTKGVLTHHEWELGRREQLEFGKVAKWHGYCHGWAAA